MLTQNVRTKQKIHDRTLNRQQSSHATGTAIWETLGGSRHQNNHRSSNPAVSGHVCIHEREKKATQVSGRWPRNNQELPFIVTRKVYKFLMKWSLKRLLGNHAEIIENKLLRNVFCACFILIFLCLSTG